MSQSARPMPVALIGLGGVDLSIIPKIKKKTLNQAFTLILIANSRLSLSLPLPASPITPTNYLPILEKHGIPLDFPSIISILSSHRDAPGIFIDSTATDLVGAMYPQILKMGVHVVTPNKKAFSGSEVLYREIQEASYPYSSALVYGESTVGACKPIVSTLKDIVNTGDEVTKIEGVFSGTLSFIFNQFSKVEKGDVKFSEVLKIAKDKGFTVSDKSSSSSKRHHST